MNAEELAVYYNVLFTLLEKLKRVNEQNQIAFVHEGNYIFKAYHVESKLHFEIMNFSTMKTIFHTTNAPNFYIDTTLYTDTCVILMFMSHLSDRNLFNRVA